MKMVSDMERIGDQACDITGIVKKDAEVLELNLTADDLVTDPESCTVTRAVLTRNGVNYNLCITIIPWKVGGIEFKTFDLASFCSAAGESSGKNTGVQAVKGITVKGKNLEIVEENIAQWISFEKN